MKKRHHYQTVTLLFIATLLSISTYNCAEIEVDIEDETSNRVLLREPETHEPIININNVVVHNDTIYIGAENVLLKVDARTLRIVQSVRTGPLLDSPMCRYAPREECLYSRRKSLTPNYNKIVLVLPDSQSLLTCWTAFQGVCETRDLDDLSRLKSNSTVAVVANDPVNSTIAFQATSPNSQRLLYVATTYTSLGAYRDDLPALSGRSLQPHRFMQVIESNNQLKTVKSSIEFVSRFRKSFIVKYITGFNLGLHNYYLSVQHTDTDALLANQPLATKISRLCLNDLSFTKSYTEITLKCLSGSRGSISSLRSVDYNELIASKLVDIDGEHFLIGLFQQTSRTNFNMSLHTSASSTNNNNAPIRQAICVYPMKAVTAKIHENINRCYNSDSESQVMRGLNFIKPDQKCSYSSRRPTSADDYCASSADNGLYPIGGQQPLQTNSIIEFDTHSQLDKYSSSFDTMQFINRRSQESDASSNNILILMSTARSQLSLYAFTSLFSEPQLIRTVRLRPDDETVSTSTVIRTPLTNIQPTENGQSVIVATGSSLYKVELDSCASLKTCAQCAAKSPHCGWCSGQCTTSSQCPSSQWLSGPNVDEVCADVRAISPQRKFKYDNEWIEVEFKRDLALLVPSNASYECVFRPVGNGEDETRNDAILVSATKLKCALPHSSKIRFNAFTEQQLELSADGLFRVSPANKYYYEQTEDETSLQVHIRTKAGQELGLRPRHNVTLVDCNAHRSCISCMSTSGCEWCSNRCSNPSEIESKSECRSDAAQCESFDTGTSKLLIPFTAHRQQAPLLVSLSNLGSGEAPLECMFTLFNGRSIARNLTVPYQPVNATHANCALNGVFNILAGLIDYDGQVQTNLRLYDPRKDVFVDSISNGRLALLFYKCEIKAADCSQCLSVNPQLSCMWCQSSATKPSCRFMNAQSKQAQLAQCISSQVLSSKSGSNASSLYQCDKPQVDLIEPSKLPIGGGTVLSIYGNNLGSRFEDIMEVNLVCPENNGIAIKCDLIERKYVSSRQIWCETRASLSGVQYGCKVMVKLRPPPSATGLSSGEYVFVTSSQLVDYVDPIISDIEPKQVIESAKYVWLTITGVDLDAGRSRSIQIIDYAPSSDNNEQQSSGTQTTNTRMVKCEIKNSTSKQIRCRLNDKFEQLGKKNLKLAYDKSMTVLNYLSLRVHSDPIVKSIDCKQTIYAGGTSFKLHGLGFDSVQSIYAYVSYRNVWYSEPVQARARLSNDLIEFDYPPLNDAFHSLVLRQQQQQQQQTNDPLSVNYELEIGFLMDGFNVTLKNTLVTYRPNPKISVSSLHIEMQQPDIIDESTQTATNSFVLAADVNIDPSLYHLYHSGVIRDNFQVFIGCSLCTNPSWFNQSRFSCRLPALNQKFATTNQSSAQCESKIYSIILSKLNQNQLSLLNIVVGNMEVTNEAQIDDNLKIYMQTFTLNNVDNFMQVAQRLSAQTTNSHLINKLIKSGGSLMGVDDDSTSNSFLVAGFHGSSSSSRNLLIVSSIIGAMLIILAIFTLVLVSIVVRIKRRNRKLDSIGISGEQKFRLSSRKMALSNTMSSSLTSNSVGKKRSEKHMKLEFEQIQKQVDMLEMQIRGRCAQAYQQLHQDYVNELNNELIYNVYSMPMWNYGSYLLNLFSARVDLGLDEQAAALPSPAQIPHNPSMMMANGHLMSSSSMSNSTTNTLLSQTHHMKQLTPGGPPSHPAPPPPSIPPPAAPGQQQQPLNSTMSVYATIKSSSMLRFDALDTPTACDPHLQNRHQQLLAAYGQLGEAMHLFDQLLHNKNFLLTFVSSYAASHRHSHADLNALAGLICLSLRDNLPYLYSIIKALISEHIRKSISSVSNGTSSTSKTSKSSTKHLSKSLFRSENTAEFTLVECLVSNFLGMFMFDFQRDTQCSTHLYRLVRVVGHYLDSAPCDSVQQRAMNSLSEDKLLVIDGAEYQMIYVNVAFASQSQSANKALFVVPLVDLDTVEQAKEKCIDVVARHGGFSGVLGVRNRPTSRDVDLELCLIIIPSEQQQQQQQPNASTMIVLRDTEEELLMHQNHGFGSNLNSNNINKNGSKRLLTLKDYNIQSGSFINLSLRTSQQQQQQQQQDTNQHVYMSTMSMANEYQVYASSSSSSGQPLLTTTTSTTMTITPSNNQRFHLLKPTESTATAVINSHNPFSTTASTASSSSDTQSSSITSTTTSNNNSTNKKSSSKSSKYEKLLTVKSQDSGVTTASLLIPPPPTSPPPSKTTILTRLLLNKGTVQPFIDQFVESIFLNTANLPPIVQHLFEFVDAEIRKFGGESVNRNVADELVRLSRAWKTHVLFVRYWTQLIRSPEILFDCRKSPLLQASLDCIAQALMDSCSSMDAHNLYDTNSPTNRLLFIREVPRYKLMIDQFYSDLKQSQPISDHELHFYLNEFGKVHPSTPLTAASQHQQQPPVEINQAHVLLKCYSLYEKCEAQCNQALGQQQCSILLPVHHRLVQIKDLIAVASGASPPPPINPSMTMKPPQPALNPTATLNPNYLAQFVSNTYAATSDVCLSHFGTTLPHHNQIHHNFQLNPNHHQPQQYF